MRLTKSEKTQLINKWLGEITLGPDELEFPYELADNLMDKLKGDPKHWDYKALENKRRGFIAEQAFLNLLSEARLSAFWANVGTKTWGEEHWRPYDFHIAKSQMKNGDIEIKSLEPHEEILSIKDIAWKNSESHYVVVFEILNPEILSLNIQEIKAKKLSAKLKLLGYLTRAQVNKRKPTPDTFWASRKFERKEFKPPERFLRRLIMG